MADRAIPLLLASQSPRRQKILSFLSVPFKVVLPKGVDETPFLGESARHLVRRLALSKARSISRLRPRHLVLAADTVVVKNGKILGKPKDRKEAEVMLNSLENSRHEVYTGVALVWGCKCIAVSHVEVTKVFFGKIETTEMNVYLATSEPYDKAGAYAIQGTAKKWIRKWEGDYFNVVGLPIEWMLQKLATLKS